MYYYQTNNGCSRNFRYGGGHGGHGRGCGSRNGSGGGCGASFQRGNRNGSGGRCGGSPQKGSRRRLFEEKYALYLKENQVPEFETDNEFNEWLNSSEGQKYSEDMEKLWQEVEEIHPWGGKRAFAGRRKSCAKKIPFNRRISEEVLEVLKQYSEKHQITETEALEKAILLLREQ